MNFRERSKIIFQQEIAELQKVAGNIGEEMNQAVDLIYNCTGKLVVMGVGKTGTIGHKISSSLASTGTPSIFINASEAMHGDLGMVDKKDIVMLISNSGSSHEILDVIGPLKRIGCRIIAMTGNLQSPLAKEAEIVLNVHVDKEACPLGLAPTTSTTATSVMGDALMICLMEKRNFQADNYALYHPGGALGRKLLCKVKDVMTTDIPKVAEHALFKDIIYEVSNKRLGMTLVADKEGNATGIITDGDIRRAIQKYDDLKSLQARACMTTNFKSISKDNLLSDALALMDDNNITTLAVRDNGDSSKIIGILSIHHIIDFK